jgi:hypothetical protein
VEIAAAFSVHRNTVGRIARRFERKACPSPSGALGEALAPASHGVTRQVEQLSRAGRRRPRAGHHVEAGPYHAKPAVGHKARQHGVAYPAGLAPDAPKADGTSSPAAS